jgi:hypothetical protein
VAMASSAVGARAAVALLPPGGGHPSPTGIAGLHSSTGGLLPQRRWQHLLCQQVADPFSSSPATMALPRADPDQHLDGAWRRLRPGAWCSATSLAGVGFGSVDCDGDGMGADQIEVVCNGDGSRQRGTFEAATRFTALMPVGLA